MKHFLCLAAVILSSGLASNARAAVTNGGFETGDYTGWSTIGYSSIADSLFGSGPVGGSFQALMTTGNGPLDVGDEPVTPSAIEAFLGLSSGALNAFTPNTPIEGAAISQMINANVGDVLSFSWNFLTQELTPDLDELYTDFSFWSLVSANKGLLLANTFSPNFIVSGSPSYFEETGFQTVSYTFTASGSFLLGFGVGDADDEFNTSALLIDNVSIRAAEVPAPASLILWSLGGGLAFFGGKRRRGRKAELAS